MKTLTAFILSALAAFAQTPAPSLNCNNVTYYFNGLDTFCEIRETSVWFDGSSFSAKHEGSGSFTVVPGDGPEVQLQAQVVAAGENVALAASVAALVELDTSSGGLVIRGPRSTNHQNWAVHVVLRVPRSAALTLTNINGKVDVSGFDGSLNVSTVNGRISLTGVSGDITARGVNGVVHVEVNAWRGQTIKTATVNGGIEIEVPADTAAHVQASSTAGTISADLLNAQWTLTGVGKKASFDIGGGGPTISADLVAGSIHIRQAKP